MTIDHSSDYNDEIDLRAIFQTLWKARLLIIITTLAAAVVAFVYSFWFSPRTYQATAYVFIGKPVVALIQPNGFTVLPTLPDIKAVVELSTAPNLLESVLKDPAVVAVIGNEVRSIGATAAIDVGKDQLSLRVTSTDPERAALLANIWAERVTETVNDIYGLGSVAQTLDSQVLQSQHDYDQAQADLEDALSKSQVDALNAQLLRKQADLKCVLDSSSQTMRVLDDLQVLEQGWKNISGELPISLGDGLALTTLRQRSLISQPCQLKQLDSSSESSSISVPNAPDYTTQIDSAFFDGFTLTKALETATQIRAGLQAQLTRLQSAQSRLEQEIPQLQEEVENAQSQLDQYSMKRNQSKALYADLLQTQQEVTALAQSARVASVSVPALPPAGETISRKTLMNTALAGMLGLMLSVFGALAMNWWRNE